MRVRDGIHAAAALTGAVLLLSAAVPGAIAQKQHPKKPSKVPTPATTAEGVAVYQKNGCGACHVIGGKGGKAGPDLSHIGKTWSVAKITKVVRNPKSVNPKAKMPAYPASKIGDKEMKSLAAYLGHLK